MVRPHGPQPSLGEQLAAGGTSFSFEFFPPKDDAGEAALWQAIRRLEPLAPTFVSVTYGAGGSTRDRTARITAQIAEQTTLTPVAHLTCVGASRAQLRHIVGGYADAGVRTVMALRGDPPLGPGTPWTPHPEGLDHAIDLVRLVREVSAFGIGVAAFPDGHPESPDLAHDARVLAAKAQAGADFAVTQMCFDPAAYFRLVEALEALGCALPVVPGIMPVTSIGQVQRIATLAGALPDTVVGDRAVAAAARRGRAGPALLHAQPLDLDPGGLRQPRGRCRCPLTAPVGAVRAGHDAGPLAPAGMP